jgi:methyl-accepting chemotaxis protein
VNRLAGLIEEISSATGSQASEIEEVNAAVGHLDSMTQQNAALVEESAAAAGSLKDQADRLVEAVNAFKLPAAK